MREVVKILKGEGGSANAHQRGLASRMRMKRAVSAGCVVALVAVCCVERKSVRRRKGSRRMLHLVVKVCSVAKISSNDL